MNIKSTTDAIKIITYSASTYLNLLVASILTRFYTTVSYTAPHTFSPFYSLNHSRPLGLSSLAHYSLPHPHDSYLPPSFPRSLMPSFPFSRPSAINTALNSKKYQAETVSFCSSIPDEASLHCYRTAVSGAFKVAPLVRRYTAVLIALFLLYCAVLIALLYF